MDANPVEAIGDDCVGELLDQAVDLVARFLTDRAQLSASAGFAMNRVFREGPLRLTVLAVTEGISQPSMTQMVKRLERQDLLTRLADPEDGRVALIDITGHGRALIEDRRRVRRERLNEMMATLTSEERSMLSLSARVAVPVLKRLVAGAERPPGFLTAPADDQRKVLK